MTSIDFSDPRVLVITAVGLVVVILLTIVMRKGRPIAHGDVFRASRLSAGNRLFPTQVQITPAAVVRYTPQWFGHVAHSIHIAHVSSVRINTSLMFSDVFIETSGGSSPVACHGHRKRDADAMKQLIEQYQSAYYKQPPAASLATHSPGADN